MRKVNVLVAVLLVLTVGWMLLPASALARRVTVFGSLAIAKCTDVACTGTTGLTAEFNGLMFVANPGWRRLSRFSSHLYVPVFVNTDTDSPGGGDLDSTVVLVNVSGSSQTIKLVLRDSNGTMSR